MSSTQAKFSPLFARNAPGGPFTVQGIDVTPGDLWFVDSAATGAADDTNSGRTPEKPFATLGYAFSSDLVGSGDTVYVMPSHAETLDAAGDITMDIAGVKVIGLGQGSIRPTFTFSAALATWLITAAGIVVENVIITTTGTVDVAQGILVTGADVTIKDLEARESAADSQFADCLTFHTGAARGRVQGYKYFGAAGDASQSALQVTAVVDGCRFEDVWIVGTLAMGGLETTAANTNMLVKDIYVENLLAGTDTCIGLNAGTTGAIDRARVRSQQNDADGFNLALVGAAVSWYDPLVVNLAGERGGAWGTASAAA